MTIIQICPYLTRLPYGYDSQKECAREYVANIAIYCSIIFEYPEPGFTQVVVVTLVTVTTFASHILKLKWKTQWIGYYLVFVPSN